MYQQIEVVSLTLNCIFSSVVLVSAVAVLLSLKITFNFLTKIKWFVILVAITMRLGLTIHNYCSQSYGTSKFKFYYIWLIEQAHFMILLMIFFTVVGSWHMN